jgi:hypothetical protein
MGRMRSAQRLCLLRCELSGASPARRQPSPMRHTHTYLPELVGRAVTFDGADGPVVTAVPTLTATSGPHSQPQQPTHTVTAEAAGAAETWTPALRGAVQHHHAAHDTVMGGMDRGEGEERPALAGAATLVAVEERVAKRCDVIETQLAQCVSPGVCRLAFVHFLLLLFV